MNIFSIATPLNLRYNTPMINTQILLTIAYDGTHYAGWQRQNNALAVQQLVENALEKILNHPAPLTAASRTDAGVHALGQRAAFVAEHLKIPLEKLPAVLTGLLPNDISVLHAEVIPHELNPRFHSKFKTYTYQFQNAPIPNPLLSRYSAHIPKPLDIEAMQAAAAHFIGTHDFTAFCAAGGSAKTFTRTIYACTIESAESIITLTITGNSFLYNMVRIIAGTIMYCGQSKISPVQIPGIIESKQRRLAGKTMPPHGLTLVKVSYRNWKDNGQAPI